MTSLGEYITDLIDVLGEAHPAALSRMRQVVGDRSARIILDQEAVDISFRAAGLRVTEAGQDGSVDGVGATDSATVLALLEGVVEVTDAILDGNLRVTGSLAAIARIFQAIELLLDASPRTPALQALADRFQAERGHHRTVVPPGIGRPCWYPFPCTESEHQLLKKLDLLPEPLPDDRFGP
jgi:hypothetical protein